MSVTGGRLNAVCVGVVDNYFRAPTYELKEICVAGGAQRQGVGGRFLAYIEEELRKEGVQAITLVTRENIGAYPFYIKNGYIRSETSVHMNKVLL